MVQAGGLRAQQLVWPCGLPVGEGSRCNEGAKERLSREERARGKEENREEGRALCRP